MTYQLDNSRPRRGHSWAAVRRCLLAAACSAPWCGGAGRAVSAEPQLTFERDISPLLQQHCARCHGPAGREGGLDLSSGAKLRRGGESGLVVQAGGLEKSLLWTRIESGEMPPEADRQLPSEARERIRNWILQGATFTAPDSQTPVGEHDVIPILLLRCVSCHGASRQEAALDLRTRESLLRGGKSGPVIKPGDPSESRLLQRIERGEMPPPRHLVSASVKPMPPGEQRTLAQWIAQGLPTGSSATPVVEPPRSDADLPWSFYRPQRKPPPAVSRRDQVRTAVDAFVLAKLEPLGLALAAEADRPTLLRRMSFDLLGLPPTAKQLERFNGDKRPDAYERLVDELLASPRYGERWGRHWLDAAGYADSEGAQNQDRIRGNIYRYRDYVIRAYNSDKPYDRQLREQIAGDELADYRGASVIDGELYDNLVATGFLRTAPDRTFANITNFVPDRLAVVADEIQILGSAVLGLTLHCARCHEHKFDPLSQHDYYGLSALLKDAWDEHDWLKSDGGRTLPHVSTVERKAWEAHQQSISKRLASLKSQVQTADGEVKERLTKEIQGVEAERRPEPRIRALWSRGRPSPTYLLLRGNYLTPGPLVAPATPRALSDPDQPLRAVPRPGGGMGRRAALADWLASPRNPLTARVLVNRVWSHHFGEGLVRTLDNFGEAGQRPTHPDLLDHLAVEFVRGGWSIKRLHRLLLCSSVYRQASVADQERQRLDPELRLLSRMPLRRLDAEALRDSMLAAAGQLVDEPFGPADVLDVRADGLSTLRSRHGGWRRSIYALHRRTTTATLLENFDYPSMGPNCVRRNESIVAPQALHLLNNGMIRRWSEQLAARAIASSESADRQLELIWQWAVGKPPAPRQRQMLKSSLRSLEAHWLDTLPESRQAVIERQATVRLRALVNVSHAVFNAAAFMYVD